MVQGNGDQEHESLAKTFMKISADKGNRYAKDIALQNYSGKIYEVLDNIVEFLSVNLQAEYNRISSSPLSQLSTYEIGKNIKDVIEKQFERAIYLIEKEREKHPEVEEFIPNMLKNIYLKLLENDTTKRIAEEAFDMNLLCDFGPITDRLRSLDVHNVDYLFKYLSLLNIQRRISRREVLNK